MITNKEKTKEQRKPCKGHPLKPKRKDYKNTLKTHQNYDKTPTSKPPQEP
jgi:hypothetical protein